MSEVKKIKVETEVAEATFELGKGIDNFVGAVKDALADGWQPTQDLPAIITSAVKDLVPVIGNVDSVSNDTKDVQAFANGLYLGLGQTAFRFVKKD